MIARRTLLPVVKIHYDAPPVELVSGPALDQQIADYLQAFWPALPDKHIRMNASGPKYSWAKQGDKHIPLEYATLLAHAAGTLTAGAHLHDSAGLCRIGMLDIDQGGRATIAAALAAAHKLGYTAYGLYYPAGARPGAEHDGGRLVVPFATYADKRAIHAVMVQIRDAADLPANTEIWPDNNNAVALPLGVHLRKGTRGQLLTQAGEIVELDTDLVTGFSLVRGVRLNAAPPKVEPAQASDKMHSPKLANVTRAIQKSPVERPAGRASLDDVRARFNAEHTWPELLSAYGGTQTHDGWACNCGWQHTHDTQIAITSQDKIVSFSPNCRWAPLKGSGRARDKFGFYCDQAHGGNVVSALKELNPIQPRKARQEAAPAPEHVRYTDAQRAAYNAARQATRHETTRRDLEAICEAVDNLDMADRARSLFGYLATLCHERGVLQIAPTNEQLVTDLDMCKRYIQYSFRELEAAGLGKRQGGKGGLNQPNEAATWTFYRSPHLGCKAHQDAECTLGNIELDLVHESYELVTGAQSSEHASTLDDWAWSEVEHSADELNALDDLPAEAAPAQQEAPHAPVVLDYAECATYTPNTAPAPSHKPYTGITKHTADNAARYALVWESMRRIDCADECDQAEQLPLEPATPRRQRDKPSAADRYVVELAGMSPTELAGELKKHKNTLKKHSGAAWLKGVRDKLLLVEHELDARALHGTAPDTRAAHKLSSDRLTSKPRIQQQAFI